MFPFSHTLVLFNHFQFNSLCEDKLINKFQLNHPNLTSANNPAKEHRGKAKKIDSDKREIIRMTMMQENWLLYISMANISLVLSALWLRIDKHLGVFLMLRKSIGFWKYGEKTG